MPADPNIALAQMVRPGAQQAQSFADLSRRVTQIEREKYGATGRHTKLTPLNPAVVGPKECAEKINEILAALFS